MAVHPTMRTRCALIATAAVLLAGGCGTGVVERLLPAAAPSGWAANLKAEAEEGSDSVSLLPTGRDAPTNTPSPPRPVRIYRIGPASYWVTNSPFPPERGPGTDGERPLAPRAERAPQDQDPDPGLAKLEETPHGG